MGSIMAAALSKLFRENEDLLKAARIIAAIAAESQSFRERMVTLPNGKASDTVYQWRIELNSMQDMEDFNSAVLMLSESVEE